MPPSKRADPPVPTDVGPPCRATRFDTSTGSAVVVSAGLILYGFALINESTTTEAEVDLFDSLDAESVPVFPVTLLPQESVREWFGDRGIWLKVGLFASAVIGGVKGAVFWLPAPPPT